MPIYEYTCPRCRKVFEEWVKTHDTGPQDCPDCGASSPHIVSNTSFVLKGGGWYVTEYGKNSASSSKDSGGKDDSPKTAEMTAPEGAAASKESGKEAAAPSSASSSTAATPEATPKTKAASAA